MPTYDYRCNACEHEFELVQSMRAPVKRKCPQCGKLKLERLIGIGAGFIIKGGTSSVKAEAAEKASDEKASKKATEKKGDDGAKGKKTATPKASDDAKPTTKKTDSSTTPDKAASEPIEKKLSGSTSTPTHRAREGRGVGNLVDAAKRRVREDKPGKATAKKSTKERPAKG